MKENIYFTDANTCEGYVTFIDEYLKRVDKVIVLSGMSKEIRERVFDEIRKKFLNEEVEFTVLLGCGEKKKIVAITDEENVIYVDEKNIFPKMIDKKTIDFSDCYIDLEDTFDIEKNKIANQKQKLCNELSMAKKIHDDWEKIYIKNMDFEVLNQETDNLIKDIIKGQKKEKTGKNKNGFFGSMLPDGNVNYIDEITKDLKRRIFIKGRPGTGKSTIMKKVRSAANESGYDTQTFYCSFDSKSLDMVVIKELGVCIFDATPPHEKNIKKETDEIFDVYEIAVKKDTDELYKKELFDIKTRYDNCIKNAKECLKKEKELNKKIESALKEKTDYEKVNQKIEEI